MKRILVLVSLALCLTASAQITFGTNGLPNVPTNTLDLVFGSALNLLPAVDLTATNTFLSGELNFYSAPLWKTRTALNGTSPYFDVAADYFFTKAFGAGGELITLGNGGGSEAIAEVLADVKLRKDIGNVAGYLLGSGGYKLDIHKGSLGGGVGVEYRYKTRLGVFVDSRVMFWGTGPNQYEWLSRLGASLSFP
jgi:hypothetical protein